MNRVTYILHRLNNQISRGYKTVMSGIQPTGVPHIGNFFGAINQWVALQSDIEIDRLYLSIVDLHALTPLGKPTKSSEAVYQMAASLIASGLSENKISLFQQSRIPHHTDLAWILMCICPLSRVQNMPQWKEKLENWTGNETPNTALLVYPVLQAADILLYCPNLVPVGEDQIIHLELARYLRSKLISWNENDSKLLDKYLPIPEMAVCKFPKIYSLKSCLKKMSKSDPIVDSRIELSDTPDQIRKKIMKALTDSFSKEITFDNETRPALANLLNIYSALKRITPECAVSELKGYSKSQFKDMLIDELVKTIDPIRLRMEELLKNRDEIDRVLLRGHETAMEKSSETMDLISSHVGIKMPTKPHRISNFKSVNISV